METNFINYQTPIKKFVIKKIKEILEADERDFIFLLAGLYGQTITEYNKINNQK